MKRMSVYPFTAIVGQDDMKMSLILNVINPSLGGVLIKGEKGTAKSTAVRALAELLPAMEAVHGVNFIVIRQIPICYAKIVHLNILRIIN